MYVALRQGFTPAMFTVVEGRRKKEELSVDHLMKNYCNDAGSAKCKTSLSRVVQSQDCFGPKIFRTQNVFGSKICLH